MNVSNFGAGDRIFLEGGQSFSGSHSGSGIVLADVNGATIERCLAYDNGERSNYNNGGPIGVGTGNTLHNNIVQAHGGVLLIDSPATTTANLRFQGNNYWSGGSTFAIKWSASTYSTLAAWRTATSQEKIGAANTGSAVDPLLNNPENGGTVGEPARLAELGANSGQPPHPRLQRTAERRHLSARMVR